MTLIDLEFKPEDAQCELEMGWRGGDNTITPMISIHEANRILREKLEKARKVYQVANTYNYWSENGGSIWDKSKEEWRNPTHTARLVDIKEIEK